MQNTLSAMTGIECVPYIECVLQIECAVFVSAGHPCDDIHKHIHINTYI